ncbi:hypothetical protein GOODEAATRI_018032 [Goodea atripinnis]|uniref:Uncharacterized protein n=1 Tax=Goodea atripinnis TaxID=208336 RepID=A0ABV0NM70_9TELE
MLFHNRLEYQSMASAFFCSTQHYLGLTPPDSSAASSPRQDFKRDAAPPGSEGFKRGRGSSTWESPPPRSGPAGVDRLV